MYGVDFSIDTPQNVYMYQKGNLILPFGTWQQTIRCRNIKILFLFSEVKPQELEYRILEQIKQTMRDNIACNNESIYNVYTFYDEVLDQRKIRENSSSNPYCNTEYIQSIYKMNITEHYLDILKDNVFVLSEEGEPKLIDPEKKAEIQELSTEEKKKLFQEFILD